MVLVIPIAKNYSRTNINMKENNESKLKLDIKSAKIDI